MNNSDIILFEEKKNRIQIQPNPWTCTVTAFAMLLQVPVEEMIASIGHDGSDRMWPEVRDNMVNRRGHSIQEIIDFALTRGKYLIEIIAKPTVVHYNSAIKGEKPYLTDEQYLERFSKYMKENEGVVSGYCFNQGHSMFWDKEVFINPSDGWITADDNVIQIQTLHIVRT